MIESKKGDILKQNAEALVNTVNCVGIMGRGIALQFRKAFPENYKAYKKACDVQQVNPGRMFVFDTNRLENPRLIINFPTKRHWKGKSRMEDIKSGLTDLVQILRRYKIRSVAIPPLGCGLGGLAWNEVRPEIEHALAEVQDVQVSLFEPAGAPEANAMVIRTKRPRMTVGRAALLGLMARYLDALMDDSVSLLEIHKLMYFLEEAGEPLKLQWAKGTYGPYAEKLRHVLTALDGHFISGYGDGKDTPGKAIELRPKALDEGEAVLEQHPETRLRFDKVSELIAGFETPFGMELLSTVHWVATREGAASLQEAIAMTYKWNERKRMFTQQQIGVAWNTLVNRQWITPAPEIPS